MRKLAFAAVAVVLCLTGAPGSGQAGEKTTTLTGEFVWEHGNSTGDLEAVFTATGEESWDVAFHFTFRNKPHTYSGSAQGSLTAGELSGTVLNENKKRTFKFEGSFEDGVFNGKHAEVRAKRTSSTGTLTLR